MDDPSTTSVTEGFGLMFYREASLWDNARWYDPALGRFAQADTIVPGGVQGLDRYAYTYNNPIIYIDPNGHEPGPMCGRGYYEYCGRFIVLNSGGMLDIEHFNEGRRHGVQVAKALEGQKAKVKIEMTGEGDPVPGTITLDKFSKDSPELLEQYLEFQKSYEANQLNPSLWKFYEKGSAFSPEDIPSDMLGFVSGLDGYSLEEAVQILGGVDEVFGEDWRNPAIANLLNNPKDCSKVECGEHDYQNSSAKFKIRDNASPWQSPHYKYLTYPEKFDRLNMY